MQEGKSWHVFFISGMVANAQSVGKQEINSMIGTAANVENVVGRGMKGTIISTGGDGKTCSASRNSGVRENAGSAEISSSPDAV